MKYSILVFSVFIVWSCSKKQEPSNSEKPNVEIKVAKQKKNNKQKLDYWTALQKELDFNDSQITRLKQNENNVKTQKKGASKDKIKTLNSTLKENESNIIDNIKLSKKKKNFDRAWKNPLSYYHLRRDLRIKREQVAKIRIIKRETKIANKKVSSTDKTERSKLFKANIDKEIKKIHDILSTKQLNELSNIKAKISRKNLKKFVEFAD